MPSRSLIAICLLALAGCGGQSQPAQPQDAGPPDETPPTVAADFTRYEVVAGSRAVTVTATDDVAVTRVVLVVDGTETAVEATADPFTLAWDSTQTLDGLHDVRVRAYDGAGNAGESDVTPLLVVNGGHVAEFVDIESTNGLFESTFAVPANWSGNPELIDLKYHWDMPADMTHVVAVLRWPHAAAGWNLIFSTGTGFCPDSGVALAEAIENDGEIILDYSEAPSLLAEGQWFVHVGADNAADFKGQSTTFSALVVSFP
jgi:hypothetical protein